MEDGMQSDGLAVGSVYVPTECREMDTLVPPIRRRS
jgi:hypothetical protein